MKIRRFKTSDYYGVILIIIAHLFAAVLTFDINPEFSGTVNLFRFIDFSGGVSVLVPLFLVFQSCLLVECTTIKEDLRGIAFYTRRRDDGTNTSLLSRRPKILKELTMLNRQSCLSKILCGVDIAKPPSSSSSTINDYAYLVKSFFDQFSIQGGIKNALELDDANSDEEEDEEQQDISQNSFRMKDRRKNNSKRPYVPYEDAMDVFGDEEIDKMYAQPLEELLEERDGLLSFKRRRSRENKNLTNHEGTQIKIPIMCEPNNSTDCKSGASSNYFNMTKSTGFMGYTNPRFDKTAFLDKKQQQLLNATDEQDKLKIAAEVAARLRSPRQCRLLNWFKPKYTTTTTITTTSNDPSIVQATNGAAVNSMCPFTVQELQKMILDSQSTTKTATASGQLAAMAIKNSIQQVPGMQTQYTPIQASSSLPAPAPTTSYKIQRKPTYESHISPTKGPIYTISTLDEKPLINRPNNRPLNYIVPPPARPPPKTTQRPKVVDVIDDEKEMQPRPNVAGTSPYSKPKYPPRPTFRQRPQDDEQIDLLGNPHADMIPQKYHYKPLPQTTEHPILGAPYWTEVINKEYPIYPFGKPNPNGKKNRPGKVPIDFKLKSNSKQTESNENEDNDENSQERSEEEEDGEEENDNGRSNLPQNKEEEHYSDEKDESEEDADTQNFIGSSKGPIDRPPSGPSPQVYSSQRVPDKNYYQPLPTPNRPSIFSMAMDKLSLNKHRLVHAPSSNSPTINPNGRPQANNQEIRGHDNLPLQELLDQESEEESEEEHKDTKRHANHFDNDKPVSVRESEEFGQVQSNGPNTQPENQPSDDDNEESEEETEAEVSDNKNNNKNDDDEDESDENEKQESNKNQNNDYNNNQDNSPPNPNTAKIVHERDPNEESEENSYSLQGGNSNTNQNPHENYNYYGNIVPEKKQKTPPKEEEKEEFEEVEEEVSPDINNDEESQEDDDEEDDEDSNKSEVVHRRPPHQIPVPKFTKSKTTSKNKPTPKPVITNKKEEKTNNSTSSGATGFFKSFLSNHGVRTLSSITNLFYSSAEPDSPPPSPPPKNHRPGPPPKRRRRKKRPERPHHDQGSSSNEQEEDDDDDEEEEDDEKKSKKKNKPVPRPPPRPLHPLQLPPRIVAVPIYLEGKETWEGQEKPNEEEFFENSKKHSSNKKKKPEKYDYEDDVGSEESNKSSQETSNTSEGVDFGPGQKIQTEYSDIVNGYLRPGDRLVNDDRYVSGLPSSWEDIYKDINNKKKQKNKTPSSSSASEEVQHDENSDESEEDERRGPPPSQQRKRPRPPPRPQHHYVLEPID